MARDDPLATQVWKMYARTKAGLPHAQRMENLTWRMMALALRRRREEEGRAAGAKSIKAPPAAPATPAPPSAVSSADVDSKEALKALLKSGDSRADAQASGRGDAGSDADAAPFRGRRIDKGKTKIRVEGFDDGKEEE